MANQLAKFLKVARAKDLQSSSVRLSQPYLSPANVTRDRGHVPTAALGLGTPPGPAQVLRVEV
jgi:hypothetical protein